MGRRKDVLPPTGSDRTFPVRAGDVVRSRCGRTVRTVVAVDGGVAVLRTASGGAYRVPVEKICRYWFKVDAQENEDCRRAAAAEK